MSDSSNSEARRPPKPDDRTTVAFDLELPPGSHFISRPPRVPLDVMLDYCEELLAQRTVESILAQPDREKSPVPFEL